jgi:uncharacterized SAM-binding protein YcdF (DUF218 family)
MTTLKRTIEFCLSPVGIMTLLFLSGFVLGARHRTQRLGRRLLGSAACLYLVFLFTPLAEVLVSHLEQPFPPLRHVDPAARIRFVAVLGGYGWDFSGLSVTGRLSAETVARVAEGVRLVRELPGAKLVVSGGVLRYNDRPIAQLMADLARALGVSERDLVTEGKSRTTYENLLELRSHVGSECFILVTSACDLPRATAVAYRLGMKPLAAPVPVGAPQYHAGMSWPDWASVVVEDLGTPAPGRLQYLQRWYHERLGFFWYRILGYVD